MEETSAAGQQGEGTLDVQPDIVRPPDDLADSSLPPDALPKSNSQRWRRALIGTRAHIAALVIVAVVVIVCRYNQHAGHDYGDDFSLYIRQAKALTNGQISAVIRQNEFTVTHSSWHSFSPTIYPWGFPLMLAPLYVVWGIDYGVFKLLEAVLFGGALLLLYSIVTKRVGRIGGIVIMTTIGASVAYVSWTDSVLSDIPYLLIVYLTLWLLDRVRTRQQFDGQRLWPLIVVGVAAGYGFSTRREGAALIAAVVAAQAAWLLGRWWRRDRKQPFTVRWSRLVVPVLSFVAFVGVMRVVLPSPLLEHVDHTGLGQIRANLQAYGFSLAEQIGLKDPGRAFPGASLWGFAGSAAVAKAIFVLFLTFSAIGIVLRLATAFAEDIALFTYLVAATFIIGIAPFRDSRYIFSLTPLLVYFAYQGIATIPTAARSLLAHPDHIRTYVAAPIATAAIVLLLVGNGTDTWHKTEFRYDNGTYTLPGAAEPSWQQLFTEVRITTKPTDVIAFFRARTMVLYTDRDAIQSTGIDTVISNADYYARRKDASNYSQAPLDTETAATLGFTLVWENSQFELWQVPKR